MDYHNMKRRELQALCKEHNIPANSANSVMADKLSELLNEKHKQTTRQRTSMKSSIENIVEIEPAVLRRQAKKVRFSPDNELFEYELRSGKKEKAMATEMKLRRKSVAKKVGKPVVDNNNIVELIDDGVQIPVKLTRSRVLIVGKDAVIPVNKKNQGRRAVKDGEKGTDAVKETKGNLRKVTRSKVQTLEKGGVVQLNENKQGKGAVKDVEKASEPVEGIVVSRFRVTRSKTQTLIEDGVGPYLNPRVKTKSGRPVAKDAEEVEPSKEIVDIPVRVTRSTEQMLKDNIGDTVANPQANNKRTRREVKVADLRNNSTVITSNAVPEVSQELPKRKSLWKRELEIPDEGGAEKLRHGRRKKNSEDNIAEIPENQCHADKGLRRSRRNEAKGEDFQVLNQNVSKVEVVNQGKITRSKAQLVIKSFEGNSKSKTEDKAEVQRESKMVQLLEQPLEHAGRKKVNRGKSVMLPENTEVVVHLEEPVNCPSRKDTRRKSVMQKAEGKGTDKPLVGKGEMVKKTEMVESPNVVTRKTVGRKLSKEQSCNLSMIDEGLEDKENVTRSEKDASRNEMNTVASATGSHRSRKRRGGPIIEDKACEVEYASPVYESPRRSTRSASKSERKAVMYSPQNFVAKRKQQSSLKTPMSKTDNHSTVESAFFEGRQGGMSRALRIGAIIRDNSSKKRAKLSVSSHGTNDSDSVKDHAEKSNTEETPVSKLRSFGIDENVTVTEYTPAIDESLRRFTRSAIKSERNAVGSLLEKVDKKKQPSQSAIKGQPIGDVQLSSRKAAEFRPDPAVNGTLRRFTRSGIKLGGSAAGKLFEKVDKRKQQSRSALKGQPLDDALISSPEVAEVRPNPDVTSNRVIKNSSSKKRKKSTMSAQKTIQADTIEVQSEAPKETKGQILVNSGKLSASESVRLEAQDVEKENKSSTSETAIVMENVSSVSDGSYTAGRPLGKEFTTVECAHIEKSSSWFTSSAAKCERSATPYLTINLVGGKRRSPVDLPNFAYETPSGTNLSDIKRMPFSVAEVADTKPDALSDGSHQNQNQEVYVKSAILSEAEVQVAVNSGETSVLKSARPEAYEKEMELTKSGSRLERLQIDEIVKEPVVSVGKTVVVEESVDISLGVITKGNNGDAGNHCDAISYEAGSSVLCHASVQQADLKSKLKDMEDPCEPSISDAVKQCIPDDGVYAQIEKGFEHDALTCKDTLQNPSVGNHEVADNGEPSDEDERAITQKELMSEPVSEVNRVDGSIDMLQSPDMGNRDVADGVNAQETESVLEPSTNKDVCQSPVVGEPDVERNRVDTLEQSTGDDKLHYLDMDENDIKDDLVSAQDSLAENSGPSTGKNIIYGLAMAGRDVADDGVDAEKEPAKELEFEAVRSTGKDVCEIPVLGKYDGEDGSVNTKECKSDSMPSTADNMLKDPALSGGDVDDEGVGANKEHECNPKPSTGNDVSDTPVLGKDDGFSVTWELQPVLEPSTANNILEIPYLGNHIDSEFDNSIDDLESNLKPTTGNDVSDTYVEGKDDGTNVPKELEPDSEPSTANNTLEIPVSGNDTGSEYANTINDLASDPKASVGNDLSDIPLLGRDDPNATKELESPSEASTHTTHEITVFGSDVEDECTDANKELEHNSKPSTSNDKLETPAVGKLDIDDKSDGQDGGSEQERLTSNDNPPMDEQDGDNAENENTSLVPEVLIRSSDQEPEAVLNVAVNEVPRDTVDVCASLGQSDPPIPATSGHNVAVIGVAAQEESILNSNSDCVSNNLGDIDGLGKSIGIMDTKNDISFCRNEQKIIEASELDELVPSKEHENVYPNRSNEQITEEAETATENDHALGDKKEHTVVPIDHLDRDKFMDSSNHGIDELDCQPVGKITARENPIREESSPITYRKEETTVDDTVSERLVEDTGAHGSPTTEEGLPITYEKERETTPVDDTLSDPPTSYKDNNKNKQDDRVSDLFQASAARASSSIEESPSPAADLVYSVTNVEKASSNVSDRKSNQDVGMMKANANVDVAEEFFNWSEDSSLKAFFTTPTSTRISHVKDSQEGAASFSFPHDGCEDIGRNGTVAHDFRHQWQNEPLRVFNEETQDTMAHRPGLSDDPVNEMFRVPNFEDFSHQYFDDKEVDGSGEVLGKKEHFDFKDDQVDEIKQYDLSSEAAGTSHNDASDLKDSSIHSGEFEEKEETQLKGSEKADDLAFDKGMREM